MVLCFQGICPQGRGAEGPQLTQGCLGAVWEQLLQRERQAGANALVFILFCRPGLDVGQKYLEENVASLELALYRLNAVFTSLSQVLGKMKRIPGN